MENIQDIAKAIMMSCRKNAVGNGTVRVRQSTLERAWRNGTEVISFQNTNGDWFKITVEDALGDKGGANNG
jgi:hypothetical protein